MQQSSSLTTTEQSPQEDNGRWAIQQISRLLWNPKIH
jgi:hypothetical protein